MSKSNNSKNQGSEPIYKKWWLWTIIGVVVLTISIVLIVLLVKTNGTTDEQNPSETTESSQVEEKDAVVEETEKTKLMKAILALVDEGKAFDTGTYSMGEIPIGEYAFIPVTSGSNYYSEEDASGNIVDNANFSSFGWVYINGVGNINTKGVLVRADDFATLNVTSAKEMYTILNDMPADYNQGGYYKVGVDIPTARYRLSAIGGMGYVSINSGAVGKSNIVDNESFDGNYDINAVNGQFVEVSRATISPL